MKLKKNYMEVFTILTIALGFFAVLCLSAPVSAGEQSELQNFCQEKNLPVYHPPADAKSNNTQSTHRAAETESGAGVTGGLSSQFKKEKNASPPSHFMPLAPEHTGLTASSQPVLRWYISDPWSGKISFTLNEIGSTNPNPVMETELEGPAKEGIYQVRLADYRISLKPGVDYEYYLTIVRPDKERSADISVNGAIRYAEPSGELSARLKSTEKGRLPYVYAENGYWYDAVESISQLIDSKPNDTALRMQRGALLAQANLGQAAVYDSPVYKTLLKDTEMKRTSATRDSDGGSGGE